MNFLSTAARGRALELLEGHRAEIYRRTDRTFVLLMLAQWVAAIAAAVTISPQTWDGAESRVHFHVYMAVYLGGAIAALPVLLACVTPGSVLTRHVIAAAQMLFSSLLIHLTGGRIETHFHVFGSLAFLAAYRDWRVLVTGSVVVAVDHALRGIYWPQSVYGVASANEWRWLEHVGWVVFEDVFLWVAIRQSQREMAAIAARRAEVEVANERIEAASRAKSAFLAHMSHEIRTPMTAILGYAELMGRSTKPGDEHAEHARTIRRNGEHLLTILNDILDMSKIEAGKLNVEAIECSPARVMDEVMSVMRTRAMERGLGFAVEYRGAIPRVVRTDPTRVRQVLINLVSNAVKFTEAGEVRVVVGLRRGGGGEELAFEVRDTGIGMSAEQVAGLFEPFRQGDESTSRRFGGTGLGLSISRRLAELLGGRIDVASEEGVGSTFTLSLTVETAGVEMVHPALEAVIGHSKGTPVANGVAPRAGLGGRVLLADDAPDNRDLLRRLLKKVGMDVETAENGRVAVEKALAATNGRSFDVVLMDMQMPEMDGYEATSRLRERGYAGAVVALTAHASEQDREKCLRAGCDGYMAKPFDFEKLLELVGEVTGAGEKSGGRRSE